MAAWPPSSVPSRSGAEEDIDELTPERVEGLARFVLGIGSRLAPAREDIQNAVESAGASGFDLEHVDDIRYGIRSEIWESGRCR